MIVDTTQSPFSIPITMTLEEFKVSYILFKTIVSHDEGIDLCDAVSRSVQEHGVGLSTGDVAALLASMKITMKPIAEQIKGVQFVAKEKLAEASATNTVQ